MQIWGFSSSWSRYSGSNKLKTQQEPSPFSWGPLLNIPATAGTRLELLHTFGTLLPVLCDDVWMLLEGNILFLKVRGNFRRPSSLTPPDTPRTSPVTFPD